MWRKLSIQEFLAQSNIKISSRDFSQSYPGLFAFCRALCQDFQVPYADIPNLPKAASQILERQFVRSTSTVEKCQTSGDGTRKLLVRLQDGLEVESVIMVYETAGRATVNHTHPPCPPSAFVFLMACNDSLASRHCHIWKALSFLQFQL